MAEALALELGDQTVSILLKRSPRAARLSLRVSPVDQGAVVMVLPARATLAEARRFAQQQRDWIMARLAALPAAIGFAEGAEIPLQGRNHVIRHRPGARRGVWAEEGELRVSGLADHLPRRIADYLKREARRQLTARAQLHAAHLGKSLGRISVRDTRSRWGSCSSRGDLAFSWRLILAPDWVLDYVVAHEVAHLAEMNHSPAFWQVVATLTPHTTTARRWLKTHGAALHRYGA